jgi:hypothetical protein
MTVQLEEEESMHVDEKDGDTAVAGVLDWGAILSLVDESIAKRALMTPPAVSHFWDAMRAIIQSRPRRMRKRSVVQWIIYGI